MPSIFSKIVAGEIPCHRVWEDEEHLAFLDIQPWAEGHTLIIPKREEDYLFDLSPERSAALWSAAHRVAQQLKTELKCTRVAVLVLGYEVSHAHIHLIPTHSEREVLNAQRHPTDHPALAALASRLRGDKPTGGELGLTSERESQESSPPALPTTDAVEARWDEFASRFVTRVEQTTLRVARAAMDHLQLESAFNVLEIGCGGGGAGVELRRRLDALTPTANLTLTDISDEMIKIARARIERSFSPLSTSDLSTSDLSTSDLSTSETRGALTIERADAQALSYPDASFDRVFSCLNLMLVPDHSAVIRESARVLKPGGRVVWVVWGRPTHSHMMTLTPRALKQLGIIPPPLPRSTFYLGGLDTLKDELNAAGFDAVRRWYQPMMNDVEDGATFAEMTLKLRPELEELLKTEARLEEFKQTLARLTDEVISRGEGIGLDALIVVARRAPLKPVTP